MKLRAKFLGQCAPVDFGEKGVSEVTLRELKAAVAERFGIFQSDVLLSLNRKDMLTGDETTISELGIVAGDLIHVSSSDEPQVIPVKQPRPQPIGSHQPSVATAGDHSNHAAEMGNKLNSDGRTVDKNSNNNMDYGSPSSAVADQATSSSQYQSSSNQQQTSTEQENATFQQVLRPLEEPLVIRESTAHKVPVLLQELYSGSDVNSPNDALFVLLHALMLESGFCLAENSEITRMPEGWKKPSLYLTTYQYFLSPTVELDCCLMAISTGSSMAVHGLSKTVGNFKTDHLQLTAENYIRDLSQANAALAYRSLDRISTLFKDTIGIALQNKLATSAGFRETHGLLSLPCEIKMRLMCFLNPLSVCNLGQTCQQWRALYKDNQVWRKFYLESFGRLDDCSLSRNWYELFKDQYEVFVKEQERRRQLYAADIDPFYLQPQAPNQPFNFNPFPNILPHPRILGGNHDLFPQLTPGLRGFRISRGVDSLRNQNQGTGTGRGNITGSPFFDNSGTFL